MERQPRAAHRPDAAVGVVDRRGIAPGVDVVMKREAARAVHLLGGAAAAVERHLDQVEQRPRGFRQVAHFGRPVVHLQVDIGGVLAVPRRSHEFVPDALEIGRHGSRTAAAHQQVAAELEVQRRKAGVLLAFLEAGETFVGGKVLDSGIAGRRRQHHLHAAEELLVIGEVRGFQRVIRLGGASQVLIAGGGRIAAAIIRRGDHQQVSRRSPW